jgi:hypothetical protein
MQHNTHALVINSQNTSNRSGANVNSYTYYINWDSVLPRIDKDKAQTYNLIWTLKSVSTATVLSKNAIVSINFGRSNTFDQTNSQSSVIGYVFPQICGANYYFTSSTFDNIKTVLTYPSSNFITITFSDFLTSTAFVMYDYVLILNFEPIENK